METIIVVFFCKKKRVQPKEGPEETKVASIILGEIEDEVPPIIDKKYDSLEVWRDNSLWKCAKNHIF